LFVTSNVTFPGFATVGVFGVILNSTSDRWIVEEPPVDAAGALELELAVVEADEDAAGALVEVALLLVELEEPQPAISAATANGAIRVKRRM
jgi:hypothetical protein